MSIVRSSLVTPLLTLFAPIVAGVVLSGCNGGSGDDDKVARIIELFTDDSSVTVGDDVDLNVHFSFAHDRVIEENHNVIVRVRVPSGLALQPDTARVDQLSGDDKVPPTFETCSNGDTFLTFSIGQNALDNAENPDGLADAKLAMALRGTRPGAVTIEAAARYDFEPISGTCAEGIIPDDATALSVL